MPILEINNLSVTIQTGAGTIRPISDLDLTVNKGETVALVGESGSGKSMTARSIIGLIPPPGRIVKGTISFNGEELTTLPLSELGKIRGNRIAMIFQEPMTSLNPVLKIGDQLMEPLFLHRRLDRAAARMTAITLLQQVGIGAAEQRVNDYPHQFSGGQRQRILIAMALACDPELLIADEPTTALDVTIQAQILELIDQLRKSKSLTLLLITHNLGIVAERADQVNVMYAGGILESAPTKELLNRPLHPYTKGLLASLPENVTPGLPLPTIKGHPPRLDHELVGCPFYDRCPVPLPICAEQQPGWQMPANGHRVKCWNLQP